MRIAHYFKDFEPPLVAGITRYLRDVADECARRGHMVEVHVAGVRVARREELASGVIVHRHREIGRFLSSPIAPGLITAARAETADVVHLHMPNPLGEVGFAFGRRRALVCSFHAQLGRQRMLEPVYGPLRNALLGRSAAILVSSDEMAVVPELASHRARVETLPYGVSPRLHRPTDAQRERGNGSLRVVAVGRLVYYKGFDVLLNALTYAPSVEAVIIGDGPLREALIAQIAKQSIGDRVDLVTGATDELLARALHDADVFVLPSVSRAEAFGMAMSEAMSFGLPVVSTRLGTGTDWVNIHERTGLTVEPGDAEALAGALRRLGENRDERLRFGDAARARALELFSFERHVDRLIEIYERAVER